MSWDFLVPPSFKERYSGDDGEFSVSKIGDYILEEVGSKITDQAWYISLWDWIGDMFSNILDFGADIAGDYIAPGIQYAVNGVGNLAASAWGAETIPYLGDDGVAAGIAAAVKKVYPELSDDQVKDIERAVTSNSWGFARFQLGKGSDQEAFEAIAQSAGEAAISKSASREKIITEIIDGAVSAQTAHNNLFAGFTLDEERRDDLEAFLRKDYKSQLSSAVEEDTRDLTNVVKSATLQVLNGTNLDDLALSASPSDNSRNVSLAQAAVAQRVAAYAIADKIVPILGEDATAQMLEDGQMDKLVSAILNDNTILTKMQTGFKNKDADWVRGLTWLLDEDYRSKGLPKGVTSADHSHLDHYMDAPDFSHILPADNGGVDVYFDGNDTPKNFTVPRISETAMSAITK